MDKTHHVHQAVRSHDGRRSAEGPLSLWPHATLRSVSDGIHLAAAPTFAAMAFLAGLAGSGSAAALCTTHDTSPISGMALMYALMSAFHLAPWLQLVSRKGEANELSETGSLLEALRTGHRRSPRLRSRPRGPSCTEG